MKAELEKERQVRAEKCMQAIQDVLDEYSCQLVGVPQIVEGRIVAVVQLVAG